MIPRRILSALAACAALLLGDAAAACTRVVYHGLEGRVLTARSMDWRFEIDTDLWVFPRGLARTGVAGPRSVAWTSRYGSLAVSGYDIATVDGMNEAGLAVNALWLSVSDYPADDGATPRMSLAVWPQFMLDMFGSVAEAVAHVQAQPFHVGSGEVPGQPGRLATLHLSLSDASGDSAVMEWIGGRLVVHHDRAFTVMTNEPAFEEQRAVTAYWRGVDGLAFLPGTNRAADRFARASFYLDAVPKTDDARVAAAAAFSVIRNASVPYGIAVPDQPNISTTRWRVVADHKSRLYYFESVLSPNVFWTDLSRLDFAEGAPVRVLRLGPGQTNLFHGEVSARFEPAKPFAFQPAR